jgi:hypothetical protein
VGNSEAAEVSIVLGRSNPIKKTPKRQRPDSIRETRWFAFAIGCLLLSLVGIAVHWHAVESQRQLNSSLIEAAAEGKAARVRKLLQQGADPRAQEHFSYYRDSLAEIMVDTVRGRGSHYSAYSNTTALLAAIESGAADKEISEVAEVLLDAGAQIERSTYEGDRPMHCAAVRGKRRTVRLLLSRGAMVNARCDAGTTPLMYGTLSGDSEMVRLLLRAGAKVNLKDNQGGCALTWGIEKPGVVAILLAAGADPQVHMNGFPLITAIKRTHALDKNYKTTIRLLRKAGAKP